MLKSNKARFIARASHRKIIAQVVNYKPEGDETIVNTTSLELKKYGWKGGNGNICAAYLTGLLCGKKALSKGIKEGILDIGLHTPVKGSSVFAVLKGIVDSGVNIPHEEKVLPSNERIMGEHIGKHRKIELNVNAVKENIEKTVKKGEKTKEEKVKE
jgi:large subunit ribosomal protein L18